MPVSQIPLATLLGELPLFAELDEARIGRIAAGSVRISVPRGTLLCRPGDACNGLHVVLCGQVKLALQAREGAERVFELAGRGQILCAESFFRNSTFRMSAEALVDSSLVLISRATVLAELENDTRFARCVIASLSARLAEFIDDLESFTLRSGRERVIGFLLQHAPEAMRANGVAVTLPASKGIIASRLNITHEHFSRILRDLAEAGLIDVRGRDIAIPDVVRLRALAA
jgi:CRP-like cAMP-binding protein